MMAESLEAPMGEGAQDLHRWLRGTRTFMQTLFGKEGGSTGLDDEIAARGFENLGDVGGGGVDAGEAGVLGVEVVGAELP